MNAKENINKTFSALQTMSTGRLYLFNDEPFRGKDSSGNLIELENRKFLSFGDRLFLIFWLPIFHFRAVINNPTKASNAVGWFYGEEAEKAFVAHVSKIK